MEWLSLLMNRLCSFALWLIFLSVIITTPSSLVRSFEKNNPFIGIIHVSILVFMISKIKRDRKQQKTSQLLIEAKKDKQYTSSKNNGLIPLKGYSIPEDVFQLLWFSDGKYKNYDPKRDMRSFNSENGFSFYIAITGDVEPSSISVSLPISKPKNMLFVETLPYFPSYECMSSEQRWIYLNWLTNIDSLIDTGYFFVFYYGLERHLFGEKVDDAFKMILRLRKNHKNSSFLSYSSNALLASVLFHKRIDLFEEYINNPDEITFSNIYFYIKFLLKYPILPKEILDQSSNIGFSNKRYIKSNYDLFLSLLTNKIRDKYGGEFIQLDSFDLKKCETSTINIVANTSLKPRNISVPDIFSNKDLNKILLSLLTETHEDVKKYLKEQRKIENKISKR